MVPKLPPDPTTPRPPETEPRQVSSPAAVSPGENTVGTLRKVWVPLMVCEVLAGLLTVRLELPLPLAVPPWPEMATAPLATNWRCQLRFRFR